MFSQKHEHFIYRVTQKFELYIMDTYKMYYVMITND